MSIESHQTRGTKPNALACALLVFLAVAVQLPAQNTNTPNAPRWEDTQPVSSSSTNAAATNKPRLTFTEADFADGGTNKAATNTVLDLRPVNDEPVYPSGTNAFGTNKAHIGNNYYPASFIPDPKEIRTRSGVVYKGVTVQQIEANGLLINYVPNGGGFGSIVISAKDLPDNLQQLYYGYSESKPSPEIQIYLRLAESGDADSQVYLGYIFGAGKGVVQDFVESMNWYRKAAEQGNIDAQHNFAVYYQNGLGVNRDFSEAAKWYHKAADQGDAEAQFQIGLFYYYGRGLTQDYAESVKWYRKAADQGNADAQCNLAVCYSNGQGVAQNKIEAYIWSSLAAAQGHKVATHNRDFFALSMSREESIEGQRRAASFVPRIEKQGSSSDNSNLPNNLTATGTGFFITADGYLITNNHVVEDATRVRVVTSSGTVPAKVVQVDEANDIALLKADGQFAVLPVASSRTVKLGGTVATVGFPDPGLQGFSPKLAKGEIAALAGAGDNARYFQISVPVQPGNSGGALVDERGNVVGIVSAKLDASVALAASGALPENVNYAVKSSFLLGFLESVPEVSAKLKEPNTHDEKFEGVVKSAQQAAVLVLVY
jgi:TPR repeat protein